MNKILAIAFDTESAASEGLSALHDLHAEGAITLYSTAVVAKDQNGDVQIKQAAERGPVGAGIGMVAGSLVGVLAGPLGVLAGASLGGLSGFLVDLRNAGVDAELIAEVSAELAPGKFALLADVDELWMAPVDTRMTALGGLVFRRLRSEVIEDQVARETEAFNQELDQLKSELAEADEEAKATIKKQIESVKNKLRIAEEKAKEKWDKTVAEGKAKLEALDQQIKDASERRREKMEKRKAELAAEYEARSEKLKQAWDMAKQALAA